ncbi:MAG: type IVa pilus secretin PilQ [Bacteroidetes bacterium HLUCCA01]|nr:MAG: type IVa pilus secretin PilQ [Bacteroidetes bacterium HLUCCA01]
MMNVLPTYFNRAVLQLLSISMLLALPVQSIAQDRLPFREFTNPDELVTLGQETSLSQAFIILGGFSRSFEDKILIDRSATPGSIGINIPSMHWRQALDAIARANNLLIQEQREFIEVLPNRMPEDENGAQSETQPTPGPAAGGPGPEINATLDTREIEISAIFFEGNRRILREIGINWTAIQDGVVRVSNLAAESVSLEALQAEIEPQRLSGDWEVGALLNTLELLNVGEILSSPRIKVMDGQEGDIQVGQDFSIKQRDFAGNITDAFFSTGTILTATPYIMTDRDTSFIYLDLRVERSTANPDPVSTIINKQEAVTQVLLYSGESTVIAGLYETDELTIRRGIPFLKDLPPWFFGLRYIFGYNSYETAQNELIIVVRAEIIPSLRERFNLEQTPTIDVLREGRQRLIEGAQRP